MSAASFPSWVIDAAAVCFLLALSMLFGGVGMLWEILHSPQDDEETGEEADTEEEQAVRA